MSTCLGLFCCVVCIRRRLKSFTLDKADFDDSAHEGIYPLGAILLLWMCTVNHLGLPNTDSAVVITNFEHKNEFYDQDSSSDPVCIYIFSVSMHGRDCANILPLSHTKTQPQRKMACIINWRKANWKWFQVKPLSKSWHCNTVSVNMHSYMWNVQSF